MKLRIPYPILFAVYPVIFLFSKNVDKVSYTYILAPLVVVLVTTLLLLFLLSFILRNSVKRDITASLIITSFFSYGLVSHLINNLKVAEYLPSVTGFYKSEYLLVLAAFIFFIASFWIDMTRRDLKDISKYINRFAFILILFPIVNIITFEVTETGGLLNEAYLPHERENIIPTEVAGINPDIYYIILDAYPGADVLERVYQFNNTPFLEYLTENGFYVANKSKPNCRVHQLMS